MKTLETGTDWLTRLGNATAVDVDRISSNAHVRMPAAALVSIAQMLRDGAFELGLQSYWMTSPGGMRSLFYNGRRFCRTVFVDGRLRGFFFMWRWSADPSARWQFLQLGAGVKLNGRIGLICRLQNDASAAAGVSGPNLDQAIGWAWGTK